jgi:hypothetical protein
MVWLVREVRELMFTRRTHCQLTRLHGIFGGIVLGVAGSSVQASINLELRPLSQVAIVGNTVNVGLYAISDSPSSQLLSAAQVILTWDVSYVQLSGLNNSGAATWLSSAFGPEPFGLNTSLLDGDAMWIGLAPLGQANAVPATPGGTLLTTFMFQALAPTAPLTLINLVPSGGNPLGTTIVFDGTVPNTDVTGTLTGAMVQILPIPGPSALAGLGLGALFMARRRRRM